MVTLFIYMYIYSCASEGNNLLFTGYVSNSYSFTVSSHFTCQDLARKMDFKICVERNFISSYNRGQKDITFTTVLMTAYSGYSRNTLCHSPVISNCLLTGHVRVESHGKEKLLSVQDREEISC